MWWMIWQFDGYVGVLMETKITQSEYFKDHNFTLMKIITIIVKVTSNKCKDRIKIGLWTQF